MAEQQVLLALNADGNTWCLEPAVPLPTNRLLPSGHVSSTCRTPGDWIAALTAALQAGDHRAALKLPGPSDGLAQCYVRRLPQLLGSSQCFELRTERGNQLLATARRRVKAAGSSYLLSASPNCSTLNRDDPKLMAKLKGSLLGTHYLARGHGGGPSHKGFNAQLLGVSYEPTANQLKAAPRTMTAIVPLPESQARTLRHHHGIQACTACCASMYSSVFWGGGGNFCAPTSQIMPPLLLGLVGWRTVWPT